MKAWWCSANPPCPIEQNFGKFQGTHSGNFNVKRCFFGYKGWGLGHWCLSTDYERSLRSQFSDLFLQAKRLISWWMLWKSYSCAPFFTGNHSRTPSRSFSVESQALSFRKLFRQTAPPVKAARRAPALLCFLNNLSNLRILTTLYCAKNDRQWVILFL